MTQNLLTEATQRAVTAVDALADDLVRTLSEVIAIPSVNPKYPGQVYDDVVGLEGRVSRLVGEIYADAGAEVETWAVEPGRDNAVGTLKGSGGGRSLILNGHVDVVPPGNPDRWESGDPFSGRIDGDRIWGRGASDMKAGLVAQAFAAKALQRAGISLRGDLILQAVVGVANELKRECGVSVTLDVRPSNLGNDAYLVMGHDSRLGQVFNNLIDNAVRYTPPGGTIDVSIFRDGARAVVEVRDDGPGIDPAALARVFERFFRAAPAAVEGSGLGLAIAKAAAERNRATLSIDNRKDGTGIVARLCLPASPESSRSGA